METKHKKQNKKFVAIAEDIMQHKNKLHYPEIRVWCHPHAIGKNGSDYYYTFDNFAEAFNFINRHTEAEDIPLIALEGYEINIFTLRDK
jgi:hypothetical protein